MKLTYFGNFLVTGVRANQNQIFRMCSAFMENGNDVTLVADFNEHTPEQLRKLFGVAHVPVMWNIRIPKVVGASIFLAFKVLYRAFIGQSDLLMTRDVRSAALLNLFGFRIVYECHAIPDSFLSNISFWWLRKSPVKVLFVVISRALEQEVITRHKVIVAHDAANLLDLNDRLVNWPAERIIIGYAGSGYPGKGATFVPLLAKVCPEFEFIVVGVGREEMLESVDIIPDNLDCIPRVAPSEVASKLAQFDILLAPYSEIVQSAGGQQIGKWMSPLKTFEYMAAVKPIIASDLPVLREVLIHNTNCILCPPDDVKRWTQALRDLVSNPRQAIRLANNARTDVIEKYSWTARAANIIDAAAEVL